MVIACVEMNGNFRLAARLYAARHPDCAAPAHSTVSYVYNLFLSTGSVRRQRRKKRHVFDEYFEICILAYVRAHPEAGIRGIAQASGSRKSSVWNVLRKHKLHPFHVSLHQGLNEADFQKRLEFCNWALIQKDQDPDFFTKVLWTDEAQFCRNGNINVHNAHYWSDVNPHWLRQHNHQVRWTVNVWCGIFGDRIVGPCFLEDTLTAQSYTENILHGAVSDLACDLPLRALQGMWFQHDGAPAHFSSRARRWLDDSFPDQWIGRGGPMFWPPRSPDLTPLDFFLWGHVKNEVYATEPQDVADLKRRIIAACGSLHPQVLKRVVRSMEERFMACVSVEGRHFEHFL